MKICFLASGNGGNLKFLHLVKEFDILKDIELFVIADRECLSVKFAKDYNIYTRVIKYSQDNNIELKKELHNINPNIIITNWHKIIDNTIVTKYKGKMINLHYSLLPAFSGLIGVKPIKEAYKQNCQYIGATCHYVNNEVDAGIIIAQALVKTNINIDKSIEKIFQKGCLILLNSIFLMSNKNITYLEENHQFDFSPPLKFNHTIFNNSFWKRLKKL